MPPEQPEGDRPSDLELTLSERFKALFEHMQEGVALHELICNEAGAPVDYRIVDANSQYEIHTGLRRADVKGKLGSEIYGTGRPPYLEQFGSVALGGAPLSLDVYFAPLDRHFVISVAPLGPRAFATIFSDVTVTKKQAEALEKTRLAQRALLDNQPQLTWLKDREGRFLVVNQAFANACGRASPEHVVGKTDFDVWPKELAEAYLADDEAVMQAGCQKIVEEHIETAAGTRWVETYKSPVFAPDGSVVGTTGISRDITEQKRAYEAMRQSEQKFEQVFNLAPDPIAVSELSGEFLFVNQAFCNATGYSRPEMLGKRATDFGLWENPELRAQAMARASREGQFDSVEFTVVSKTGERRHMDMSGAVISLDDKKVMITAARDVTESRLAEAQAKAAAHTLSQYFELSLDMMCIATSAGQFLRLNSAWEHTLGWPLSELKGRNYLDLVHPEDLEPTREAMGHLREGNQVADFQNRYRTKDGSYRWIEWRAVPDEPGLVYAVARDITARREAEAALRAAERSAARSREQLLSVAELAHIGHFTMDWETQSTDWTAEFSRILGIPEDVEPTTLLAHERIHPDDRQSVDEAITSAAEGQPAIRLYYRIVRPNGDVRFCLGTVEGDVDETGRVTVFGQIQDLTELQRAEEERRKLEQQVMQSQKLESLGILAGGIAHDFNNLLTSILGNADLAMRELSPASSVGIYLEDIEKVSRRAAELCRQMLAYSGKGRFVVQPLSLNEIVREMVHLLSVSISKKVVIKFNFFNEIPAVMADASQLRQIVMNLITNASDAIAEVSGVITLSTGLMDCDDAYLQGVVGFNEKLKPGQYVYVEVSDTGCGIEPENLGRIFDPFFTTKFTGRGLGLAAVMGIVRGHGGALRVYSEAGRGTTFKILFPAYHEPAQSGVTNGTELRSWKGDGLILLADDEESIRSMGRRMLERLGFEVLVAADGREAVEVFAKVREKVRLVVLDMTMPHLDGEACFRELRRIEPAVKVIMTSGYNEQEVISRFVGKGLAGFVQKPYSIGDLIPVITRVLGEAS